MLGRSVLVRRCGSGSTVDRVVRLDLALDGSENGGSTETVAEPTLASADSNRNGDTPVTQIRSRPARSVNRGAQLSSAWTLTARNRTVPRSLRRNRSGRFARRFP
ncbi:hypothetical protein GCM10010521_07820 [Streptomyces rameus]|uniref:Uncharacterized protein n=1 Tax=Streptomyces rameus TaxID=68261 RepID=A0ABP6MR94_9ACTN